MWIVWSCAFWNSELCLFVATTRSLWFCKTIQVEFERCMRDNNTCYTHKVGHCMFVVVPNTSSLVCAHIQGSIPQHGFKLKDMKEMWQVDQELHQNLKASCTMDPSKYPSFHLHKKGGERKFERIITICYLWEPPLTSVIPKTFQEGNLWWIMSAHCFNFIKSTKTRVGI